jgi:hypothetical protein
LEGNPLIKDDDYDYEDEENVLGVVSLIAYKNDTYVIKTDLEATDMVQLVVDVGDDLLNGDVEGLESISHDGITKH